jgi:hypothetical protein
MADVLHVAREEEVRAKIKKPRGRSRKIVIIKTFTKEEDENLRNHLTVQIMSR